MKIIAHLNDLKRVIAMLGMLFVMISCKGGSDEGDNGDNVIKAVDLKDLPPVVFMADKDTPGKVELYVSSNAGEGITKLSGTLVDGGNVVDFQISPDGVFIAYVADQDTDQVFELYMVRVEKPAGDQAVKVSGTPMTGNGIKEKITGNFAFAWAPDSSRIAYLADQRTMEQVELFSVLPNGSDNIRLSGNLPSDGDVAEFAWAPDSRRIVYLANQEILDSLELFTVFPNLALSDQSITSGFNPGQNVVDFAWAPDSTRIAFIADKNITGRFQLWTTSPNDSNNVLVSSVNVAGGNVIDFAWAPDSILLAYLGDTRADDVFELFTTRRDRPLINPISLVVVPGTNVTDFAWAPDSSLVAYIADQEENDVFELFVSDPQARLFIGERVSGNLATGGDVFNFLWAPDSSLIAYTADEKIDDVVELFTTSPSPSQIIIEKISGTIAGVGVADTFQWAADSSRVAYLADQDQVNVIELFTSTPKGDLNDKVSGDPVLGGSIAEFQWEPESRGIAYIADQDTFGIDELYISAADGSKNEKISGDLVPGGRVIRFKWVP